MKTKKLLYLLLIALLISSLIACQSGHLELSNTPEAVVVNESDELSYYKEWYEIHERNLQVLLDDYLYSIHEITPALGAETAERMIIEPDKNIITAMKERNFSALQKAIHPVKGVRISCYNQSSTTDVVISGADLLSNQSRVWGGWSGEGSKIEMRFAELFDTFLWDKDYSQYTPIYNPVKLSENHSQALGNEYIFYDKCISVLYLYEGTAEWSQVDWSGLKLIYQEHSDGNWYLTGIIHCQREL